MFSKLKMGKIPQRTRFQAFSRFLVLSNYDERYRNGERISTGFVESTVNQVISKRMVKKQQIRWSKEGVHLLLQVSTKVLDGDWRETFVRWYPEPATQAD